MNKTIKLNDVVVVSDPCYTVPTFIQIVLNNVEPGEYHPFIHRGIIDNSIHIIQFLGVVHTDWVRTELLWRVCDGIIGVDSGSAGIFSVEDYRNDTIIDCIETPESNFKLNSYEGTGDLWYETICKLTLAENQPGIYRSGVATTSGLGDGAYRCLVAKKHGKIVGICLDFGFNNYPNKFINTLFNKS